MPQYSPSEVQTSEGYEPYAYDDTLKNRTIGVGFNMDRPGAQEDMLRILGVDSERFARLYNKEESLSDEEIQKLLETDIGKSVENVYRVIPEVDTMPESAQQALLEMDFQMGTEGMLGFSETIRHAREGNFHLAAEEVKKSDMALQTPARADKYANLFMSAQEQHAMSKPEGLMDLSGSVVLENEDEERLLASLAEDLQEPDTETEESLLGSIMSFGKKFEEDDTHYTRALKSALHTFGRLGQHTVAGAVEFTGAALQGAGAAIDNSMDTLLSLPPYAAIQRAVNPDIAEERAATRQLDNPLEIIGRDIEALSHEIADPPEDFLEELGRGAGSMVVGAGAGVAAGPLAAASVFTSHYYDSLYDQAIQGGATEEDAELVALMAPFLGGYEMIPIERAIKLSRTIGPGFRAKGVSALKSGGIEAFQEWSAGIIEDFSLNQVMTEEAQRALLDKEGLKEGGIGGILGFLMDLVIPGRSRGGNYDEIIRPEFDSDVSVEPGGPVGGPVGLEPTMLEFTNEAIQQSEESGSTAPVPQPDPKGPEGWFGRQKSVPPVSESVAPTEDERPDGPVADIPVSMGTLEEIDELPSTAPSAPDEEPDVMRSVLDMSRDEFNRTADAGSSSALKVRDPETGEEQVIVTDGRETGDVLSELEGDGLELVEEGWVWKHDGPSSFVSRQKVMDNKGDFWRAHRDAVREKYAENKAPWSDAAPSSDPEKAPIGAAYKARPPKVTPAVRALLHDSKVKDGEGNPVVVYHATEDSFDELDPETKNTKWDYGQAGIAGGTFFSADPKWVENRRDKSADTLVEVQGPTRPMQRLEVGHEYPTGMQVRPGFLNLRNPVYLEGTNDLEKQALALIKAKEDGHDGAIIDMEAVKPHYVSFYPERDFISTFDPDTELQVENIELDADDPVADPDDWFAANTGSTEETEISAQAPPPGAKVVEFGSLNMRGLEWHDPKIKGNMVRVHEDGKVVNETRLTGKRMQIGQDSYVETEDSQWVRSESFPDSTEFPSITTPDYGSTENASKPRPREENWIPGRGDQRQRVVSLNFAAKTPKELSEREERVIRYLMGMKETSREWLGLEKDGQDFLTTPLIVLDKDLTEDQKALTALAKEVFNTDIGWLSKGVKQAIVDSRGDLSSSALSIPGFSGFSATKAKNNLDNPLVFQRSDTAKLSTLARVFGHEFYHAVASNALRGKLDTKGEYNAVLEALTPFISKEKLKGYQDLRKKLSPSNPEAYDNADYILEEAVVDWVGEALTSRAFLSAMKEQNPSLFSAISEYLDGAMVRHALTYADQLYPGPDELYPGQDVTAQPRRSSAGAEVLSVRATNQPFEINKPGAELSLPGQILLDALGRMALRVKKRQVDSAIYVEVDKIVEYDRTTGKREVLLDIDEDIDVSAEVIEIYDRRTKEFTRIGNIVDPKDLEEAFGELSTSEKLQYISSKTTDSTEYEREFVRAFIEATTPKPGGPGYELARMEVEGTAAVDPDGDPVILYRGMRTVSDDPFSGENSFYKSGRVISLTSSPYVASTWTGGSAGGNITPALIDVTEVIEFEGRWNPIKFDERAAQLQPGQALVARGVYDSGPWAENVPGNAYTFAADVWAIGKGTTVVSPLTGEIISESPTEEGDLPGAPASPAERGLDVDSFFGRAPEEEGVLEETRELDEDEVLIKEELEGMEARDELGSDTRTETEVYEEEMGENADEDVDPITNEELADSIGVELSAERKSRRITLESKARIARRSGKELTGRMYGQEQGRRTKGDKNAVLTERDPVEAAVMAQRGAKTLSDAMVAQVQARMSQELKGLSTLQTDIARQYFAATEGEIKNDPTLGGRIAHLPDDLVSALDAFRKLRKAMEEELVRRGIVNPRKFKRATKKGVQALTPNELVEAMSDDMYEEYVRREYEINDFGGTKEQWMDYVSLERPGTYEGILEFFDSKEGRKYARENGIKGSIPRSMAVQLAGRMLTTYGTARNQADVTSRDNSPLKHKKKLDPRLRRFLGERFDVGHIVSRTLGVMHELITDRNTSKRIEESIFEVGEATREPDLYGQERGWIELDPSVPNVNHPFHGVYVRPETYRALRDPDGTKEAGRQKTRDPLLGASEGNLLTRAYMKSARALGNTEWWASGNAYAKAGIILTNVPSYALNASSIVPLMMAAGVNPFAFHPSRAREDTGTQSTGKSVGTVVQSLADAWLVRKHRLWVSDRDKYAKELADLSAEDQARVDEIIGHNLVDESALSEEMINQLRRMVDKDVTGALHGSQNFKLHETQTAALKQGKEALDRGLVYLGGWFSLVDTAARIGVYHNEKKVLAESGIFEDTPDGYRELQEEAALRARSGYLTYSRIPLIAKATNNFPMSAFLSFQVALVHTWANNTQQAWRDLKLAKEHDSSVLRNHALKKMVSNQVMFFGYASIFTQTMQWLVDLAGYGGDDEEKKLARDEKSRNALRSDWNTGKQHIYMKDSSGRMFEWNATDFTPFATGDMFMRTTIGVMKKLANGEEIDVMKEAMAAIEPLYAPILGSESPGSNAVRGAMDLLQGEFSEAADSFGEIEPGASRVARKLASGDPDIVAKQLWGLTGRTPTIQNPEKEAGFKTSEYRKKLDSLRNNMNKATRYDPTADDDSVSRAFRGYIAAQRVEQDKLRGVAEALLDQDMSERDVREVLQKKTGMSKRAARKFLRGDYALQEPSWDSIREELGTDTKLHWRDLWRKAEEED